MVDDEPPFTHHLKVRPYRGIEKVLDRHGELLATIATQSAELEALRGEGAAWKAEYTSELVKRLVSEVDLEATISQLRTRNAALEEENDRLSKMVTSRLLPGLLEDDEQTALVDFIKFLRTDKDARQALLNQNGEAG